MVGVALTAVVVCVVTLGAAADLFGAEVGGSAAVAVLLACVGFWGCGQGGDDDDY